MFRKKILLFSTGIFLTGALLFLAANYAITWAATNISATTAEHFAWDEQTGWWDFYLTDTVEVDNTKIKGYASSSFGYISFDCFTSPNENICGTSNYGICNGPGPHVADGTCPNATANGELSGWAWNDNIGWISFCGGLSDSMCPGTITYQVTIETNGDFSGWAWNDIVGWISFNCGNYSGCDTSNYKVNTSWRATSSIGYLESSTFDTERIQGGLLNSIVWQGTSAGSESCVSFQVAASNDSGGPWNYKGPNGDDSSWYGLSCASSPTGGIGCATPNVPVCVNKADFTNYRYLRYKVRIQSTLTQDSPEISDIILNWSP